jgi:uncharacterized protein YeaO (DUF488 family)
MPISIVRLGSPRRSDEGLRLGTVRRPPRGVAKSRFAELDYYDVWLPNVAPSQELVTVGLRATDDRTWKQFERRYRAEMKAPDASRVLDLLAALSHHTNVSVGCYCENPNRCHRSILGDLLRERGASVLPEE